MIMGAHCRGGPLGSSRVEVFEAIRRDRRAGLSIRALAERHGVHRRTGRQALDDAGPRPRKVPVRRAARLGAWKAGIDEMLVADLGAPRKARPTARRGGGRAGGVWVV